MAPEPQFISLGDVIRLAAMSAGSVVATATPLSFDAAVVDALFRASGAGKRAEIEKRMAAYLPAQPAHVWRQAAERHSRMQLEDLWGRLRAIGPRRWKPSIVLDGEDRVRAALDHGRGAILWSMRFASATAIKMALHQAGLPLVHLSGATHGTRSTTLFAERVLSPIYSRAENPYLAARVIIPSNGSLGYVATLREHLRRNACVSIFGEHVGRGSVSVPFLGGVRSFATGAPALAWQEDAALFTTYAIRTAPFAYRVVIDESIPVDRSLPRKEYAAKAVAEFVHRLETLIARHPADWQGWSFWETEAPH